MDDADALIAEANAELEVRGYYADEGYVRKYVAGAALTGFLVDTLIASPFEVLAVVKKLPLAAEVRPPGEWHEHEPAPD